MRIVSCKPGTLVSSTLLRVHLLHLFLFIFFNFSFYAYKGHDELAEWATSISTLHVLLLRIVFTIAKLFDLSMIGFIPSSVAYTLSLIGFSCSIPDGKKACS